MWKPSCSNVQPGLRGLQRCLKRLQRSRTNTISYAATVCIYTIVRLVFTDANVPELQQELQQALWVHWAGWYEPWQFQTDVCVGCNALMPWPGALG